MNDLFALLPEYAAAHLELSLGALAIATAIAVPLGIAVTRRPRLAPALLGGAGVIQTIPSLALLALMVPLFAAVGVLTERWFGIPLRAIGAGPALVALTLYGVLPILQNTVAGLRGVDPGAREAARAVGMTPSQSLWRVELPAGAAGAGGGPAHRGGVDRRHRDALDARRRDEPRELHLQRPPDAPLRRGLARLHRGGRARADHRRRDPAARARPAAAPARLRMGVARGGGALVLAIGVARARVAPPLPRRAASRSAPRASPSSTCWPRS